MEDVYHYAVQLAVDFLEGPAVAHGVLAHLQSGSGYAAGVGCLGRSEEYACLLIFRNSFRSAGHVGTLSDCDHAVRDKSPGGFFVNIVLGCARESHVALYGPDALAAFGVDSARNTLRVLLDASSLDFLYLLYNVQLDAVRVVYVTVGVGHRNYLAAQSLSLLAGVDRNVSGTGDDHDLVLEAVVPHALEHLVGEVAQSVAGGLSPCQRSAVRKALAGKNAGVLVSQSLVLTEQVADLSGTYAYVACRNVGVGTDVPEEFSHEALAEAHDLSVGLALGIEVGAALAAADGQTGEAVLEDLLESQELDDGDVYGRVKPESSLIGTDGRIELDAVSAVHLDLTLIVYPGNAEDDLALRLYQALEYSGCLVLGVGLDDGLQGFQDLVDCLQEFRLARIALFDLRVDSLRVIVFKHGGSPLYRNIM